MLTSQQIEKGKAPGMQVQLLSENHGRKEYAVIFRKGDEAFSGLSELAERYHVTSAHFTAIGALRGATLAWFSPERKMYKKIPVEGQLGCFNDRRHRTIQWKAGCSYPYGSRPS